MKKLFAVLALAAALFVARPVKAQYTNPNDACNAEMANAGRFANVTNNDGGPVSLAINMTTHYSAPNYNAYVQRIKDDTVLVLNQGMAKTNGSTRFRLATDSETANFILNFEVYNNGNGGDYRLYLEVRGWGVGHLFRFSEGGVGQNDVGEVYATAISELPTYFVNGWTCGTRETVK